MIKLPEPAITEITPYYRVEGYTEAQLKQAVRDAYEDAAKKCETQAAKNEADGQYLWEAKHCAAAIRALAQEPKP